MSDPSAVLRPAIRDWLRTDANVIAAFGSSTVLVFAKIPPVNQSAPYVHIPQFQVFDDAAECLDAVEIELQVEAWSLTPAPGYEEAESLCAAISSALARISSGDSPAFNISGFRVGEPQYVSTIPLADLSGKTVGRAVKYRLAVDPT